MHFSTNTPQLNQFEIDAAKNALSPYVARLREVARSGAYDFPEGSINLPFDEDILSSVALLNEEKKTAGLKYVVVVGIGGSNLGAKAVYDALYGSFDLLLPERFPKLFFFDTSNPEFARHLEAFLARYVEGPEELLINVISKSGETVETIANAEFLLENLKKRFSDIFARLVITTDYGSKLWLAAEKIGAQTLPIPQNVGGRFSVFSAVGLFPLSLCGIEIKKLLEGARHMREQCLKESGSPAHASAAALFVGRSEGLSIHDSFFFNPELESLGKWYRQLAGESLGKEKDTSGKTVYRGFTPTISIGSTDLHSVGQLYLGGPRDKITTFIRARSDVSIGVRVPEERIFDGNLSELGGKSFGEITDAILAGVKIAYEKAGLPFMEIEFDTLSEYELGQFLQFKMIEIMYLGTLMNVNAFDQPNVELYKEETRKLLRQ